MALTDIQMQAIQDAEDIDTGVDTRTKEEMLAEQMSNLKSAGKFLKEETPMFIAESTPGLGEAIAIKRTSDAIDEEDYVGAGIEATAGVLGMVPIIGDAAGKTLRTATKSTRKGYNPEDPASRVFHLTKTDFDSADVVGKGTNDIGFHVGTAAQATSRGSSNVKYDKDLAEQMVKDERILPMVLKNKLKPARIIDVGSFKEPKNWIANLSVAKNDKQLIKFLLDEPADADLLAKAPRVTVGGDTYYMLPDVMRSGMDEKLWKDIILEAHRARRVGLNTINKQEDRVEWFNTLKQTANKNGYDSFVYKNEYEGASRDTVPSWQEELNTSSLDEDSYMLLEPDQAKGLFGGMTEGDPRYMKNEGGLMLQKGGAIPMDRQMSMFDEGGLEDDGGTVDPVSGNDVPPGSTQEEVRDDIPAQLSEGEFVFPADVVRYIGLGNLMTIRQEAKMGLKMMDEMGQMGNSEEATMPDDLPFDINDLDMEDEDEYNTRQEFAVGGMPTPNPNTGVYYNPATTAPTTGVAAVPQQAASQQYVQPVRPQQAAVPTMRAYKPSEIPTFTQTIGSTPGQYDELREYKNESGEVRQIPFKAGQPIYPIPEGFTYVDPEATKTEEVTTTPTDVKTQTTRVREEPEGDAGVGQGGAFGDMEKMNQRNNLSKSLGFTTMETLLEGVGGTFGTYGKDSIGKRTGTGYIIGEGGQLLDPLTGTLIRGGDTSMNPINIITGALDKKYKNQVPFGEDFMNAIPDNLKTKEFYNSIQGQITTLGKTAIQDRFNEVIKNTDDPDDIQNAKNIRNEMMAAADKNNVDSSGSIINPFEMPGARGGGSDDGFAGTKESQQRAAESAARDAANAARDAALSEEGPDRGNETTGDQTSQTTPDQDSGSSTGGYYDFNQGGLASKPKPKKTKKMKRGGLASK